jgi:hypothetical protein
MRRQDLLEQRRSGAGQADDENRIRRIMAAARSPLEKLRRADVPLGFQILRHLFRFVGGLELLQPVALFVVAEGRREVALVGQRVISFAMMRRAADRRLVGIDGILVIAAGLVRMSLGKVDNAVS